MRLVYADWLEEHGDPRAEVLQLHVALAQMRYDDDTILDRGSELVALGMLLDRAWLDAIAWPPLSETCWAKRGADGNRTAMLLRSGGTLRYRHEGTHSPGTWIQVGNAVRLRINDFSTHLGIVFGSAMRGVAENDDDQTWRWAALPLPPAAFEGTLPDLPAEPRDTPPLARPR